MADESLDGRGHRARLRRRLFEGGPEALLEHELIEYLLALALPRRDTKPLAKKLIRDFGGFCRLLQVLDGEMPRIPMIVMNLATPTRDTHVTGSFRSFLVQTCSSRGDARGTVDVTPRQRIG